MNPAHIFSVMGIVVAGGCSPKVSDTVGLISAGDERACATETVKERLRKELTPFVGYRKLKRKSDSGEDLSKIAYVFNPIISTNKESGRISCAAVAYLSKDGKTPWRSNTIELNYSLNTNLNKTSEFTVTGNFGVAIQTSGLLYDNSGLLLD